MRPWVPRAIALTVVYGVGQAAFVALSAWSPSLSTLWSLLLLGLLLGIGVVWAGAEVVLGRRPPEWTWFTAALAAAPAAGVLTWLLLLLFVDETGVEDLGTALVGRAAFTALLVLGSVVVGSRLGWFALRRDGRDAEDPALDADDEAVSRQAAQERVTVGVGGPIPRIPRIGSGRGAGPTVAGVRTSSSPGTVEESERVYTGRRAGVVQPVPVQPAPAQPAPAQPASARPGPAGPGGRRPAATGAAAGTETGTTHRAKTVAPTAVTPEQRERAAAGPALDPRVPTSEGSPAQVPGGPTEAFASPVVAVLPTSDLPSGSSVGRAPAVSAEPAEEDRPRRRRFGLRRPNPDAEPDDR